MNNNQKKGSGAARRRSLIGSSLSDRCYWQFLTPALALYSLVFVVPTLFGLWVSFSRWSGPGTEMTFVGLRNYYRLWLNDAFRSSFYNTLVLVLLGGALVFLIVFAAMAVLREAKGRAFIRSVVFLPIVISPIAVGTALGFVLNPDGTLNNLLDLVNLEQFKQAWLAPENIFKCIVLGFVWSTAGLYVAILMAAVDSIPKSIYEDARLAGASRWQQFRDITLPLSWDALSVAAVIWVINSMKVFEIVLAFTGTAGTPPMEARTLAFQQYLALGSLYGAPDMGFGSAIGFAIMAFTVVLVVLIRRVMRRERLEIA